MSGVQRGLSTNAKDAGCNSCDYAELGADELAARRDLHRLAVRHGYGKLRAHKLNCDGGVVWCGW